MPRVQAVCFDLWDTVFVDDSDEPKRKALGLPPKAVERRELVHRYLARHAPVDRVLVDCACDTADAAFWHAWRNQQVTWIVRERLGIVLAGLRRELPADEFAELVRLHEEMELRVRPDLAPGVAEVLRALAQRYKLAVVSDAIFTPGWALRELLAGYGLKDLFSAFAFSHEVGRSKPAREMFERAAQGIGCRLEEMVHVGDREHNDVRGARAAGCRAVLVTVVKDRGSSHTQADAVCRDYAELPAIIAALDRE